MIYNYHKRINIRMSGEVEKIYKLGLLVINMGSDIFYIKSRRLFSKEKKEIEFFDFSRLEKVSYDCDDFESSNSNIIRVLDDIALNLKKISFYGLISDFERVSKIVEKMWKGDKKKFVKPKNDDYIFAEITSSVEILEVFENQLIGDDERKQVAQKKLREYVNDIKRLEHDKIDGLKLEICNLESEKESIENERESFYNDFVKPLDSSLSEDEESLRELQRERDELEKNDGTEEDRKSLTIVKLEKLRFEKKRISSKLESLEFDVKVLNERINILNRKKKLGIRRVPNVWLMFVTLGLIYWTKVSDIDYKINVLHIKVAKMREKILKVNVSVSRKEREIDELSNKLKESEVNKSKEAEKREERILELDKNIREFKTEIDRIVKEIESLGDNLKSFDKKIEDVGLKLDEVKHARDKFCENSSSVILDKLESLNGKQASSLREIKDAKEKMKEQRVKIPKDCILNINSQSLRGEK